MSSYTHLQTGDQFLIILNFVYFFYNYFNWTVFCSLPCLVVFVFFDKSVSLQFPVGETQFMSAESSERNSGVAQGHSLLKGAT